MAHPATADLDRGRKVGKYEILTRLSIGGMAELFLAYTSGPGGFRKFVALKQILPDVKKDEQFVNMFLDEARITAAFSHANIGQVFDLGEQDGELYLAMEFISGQNLEQVMKRAQKREKIIPIGFACRVVRDACLALHYAHHFTEPSGKPAPVVHRDVSPKNVMVTYSGDVKMIDFGIAKAKNRLNRTQVGIVKGTSGYMSPEQVRGEPLDGRSDLFSAAVMLHELLTGQRLFKADSDAAMMHKIVDGEVPRPRDLNPKVPEALSEVVVRGLSRKREHRYATGKELARAIEQAAGALMFDEEKNSKLMHELFEDKIETTRSLLELASRDDAGGLSAAARSLRDEAEPAAATPRGRESAISATPAPRRGPAATRAAPVTRAAQSTGAGRYASKVAADYALYNEADVATVPERPDVDVTQDIPARALRRVREELRDDLEEPPEKVARKKRRVSAFWVVMLLIVGAAAFATTRLEGPIGDQLTPKYLALERWLLAQLEDEPPPDTSLKPIERKWPPPEVPKQNEQATAQHSPPANEALPADPEPPSKPLEDKTQRLPTYKEVVARIERLKKQYPKGDRALPLLDKAATLLGENPDKGRIIDAWAYLDNLERNMPPPLPAPTAHAKRPDRARPDAKPDPESAPEENLPYTTRDLTPEGQATVLDTRSRQSAAKHGVGWLTLYTVPPAAVFDGATSLGTSPLIKVPLEEGTYRLRLIDPDSGEHRVLSTPIRAGQETRLKIRVADLPVER